MIALSAPDAHAAEAENVLVPVATSRPVLAASVVASDHQDATCYALVTEPVAPHLGTHVLDVILRVPDDISVDISYLFSARQHTVFMSSWTHPSCFASSCIIPVKVVDQHPIFQLVGTRWVRTDMIQMRNILNVQLLEPLPRLGREHPFRNCACSSQIKLPARCLYLHVEILALKSLSRRIGDESLQVDVSALSQREQCAAGLVAEASTQ
mmetsp:Transcript_133541/g.249726  ORF Transcript_133541/g.249726 Transcript_133541/m.249726 type:complete len:210 (+) Transcript_133541:257-886(+)